jgi:hypothetical protein
MAGACCECKVGERSKKDRLASSTINIFYGKNINVKKRYGSVV